MPAKLSEAEVLRRISESEFEFVSWVDEGFSGTSGHVNLRCRKGHVTRKQVGNTIYAKSGCVDCFDVRTVSDKTRKSAENCIAQIENTGLKFVEWCDGGYKNNRSRCVVICDKGHVYEASVTNIVDRARVCKKCSTNKSASARLTKRDAAVKMLSDAGFKFISWSGEYRGVHSYANVECSNGHVIRKSVASCYHKNATGCSVCSKKYKKSRDEMIAHINSRGFEVLSYTPHSKYRRDDVVDLQCPQGHQWYTKAVLIADKHGCPRCAKYGFDKSSPAHLYALLSSDHTKIKIGITNKIDSRLSQLKAATPFPFQLVGDIQAPGRDVAGMEREAKLRFKSAALRGFDGATEWFESSCTIFDWLHSCAKWYNASHMQREDT